MTDEQLESLRAALLKERSVVAREIEAYRSVGGEGEGFADSGHVTAERSEAITRIDQLEAAEREIAEALQRMEEGTYGICERCGSEIPIERLEVIPTATLCIACRQQTRS